VDLTPVGLDQASAAGRLLKARAFEFDVAYTSVLKRATRTLWQVLEEMDQTWLPVVNSWRLNERHHGALQGHTATEVASQYGTAQALIWQRSYDSAPPALEPADPRNNHSDLRYAKLARGQLPLTESLKDTVARVLPFWHEALAPAIRLGKRGVVAAHGDSIRALVKILDDVPDNQIIDLDIPVGTPLVYELDDDLTPLRHYALCSIQTTTEGAMRAPTPGNH
jgi:2,3-bisphosphoglycerate-dependent phosphoglycerate mutase